MPGQSHVNLAADAADQFMRRNKWGIRIIKRGTDYGTAEIVNMLGFPDEVILARSMWPDDANRVCNEHNDTLAKILFPQT